MPSTAHSLTGSYQLPIPIVCNRLLKLIPCIHNEGTILDNRLIQGSGSKHQKSGLLLACLNFYPITIGQHSRGMCFQRMSFRH